MNTKNICEKLTKTSDEKQRQLLRNFSRLSLEIKLQIFDLQKSIFHRLKQTHNDVANNILTYCSLIESIDNTIKSNEKLEIKALAIKHKNQRKARKREKILEQWAIIKSLKNEQKMSFREIAKYLKKYHKFEVVHSTIYAMWNELEK